MNKKNKTKNLLVTGGAGFIGSNFIRYMLKKYKSSYKIINVDKLTYCGNLKNLEDIAQHPQYKFFNGDICNKSFIKKIMEEEKIEIIINFAAESSVDKSIEDKGEFIRTNIEGVKTLLNISKGKSLKKFLHISTDEVYGSVESDSCNEEAILNPSNNYAVSKAAADLLCSAYYKTFNVPTVIARPPNNFGPFQYPEKIIPKFITYILNKKSVPLYGDGLYTRDWIYVEDTCNALDMLLHKSNPGEIYNISAGNLITNLELTKKILNFLGKEKSYIEYVKDRPGHDRRYSIDSSKIKKLGWNPICDFKESLKHTIHWYQDNKEWWKDLIPFSIKQ